MAEADQTAGPLGIAGLMIHVMVRRTLGILKWGQAALTEPPWGKSSGALVEEIKL